MCAPSRRHRTDWWYYNDEEVVARARQVSLRAKEDKWLEWCATFSQHTSLGQMWRSVRTASGAAPPRPAAHPHPQQEAEKARHYLPLAGLQQPASSPHLTHPTAAPATPRRGCQGGDGGS
ncbi:hypothetical protein Pcinc_009235 [Petrolisthes cinctipes]|uniref:Uncharacterized protein n=1 Tax=Petrolisthes cinctipes TaxID=88211 RepID=A0AAE1G5K6_PETCI|nr:hypothetical protein Pcinc_009235 [Petrolisthes cinctipes]